MESLKILDKMLYHLREEAKNLVKKYTSAYLSRLMQREGFKKDPMDCLSNLEKILQDNRNDPMQLYKILQEFYGILLLQHYRRDRMKSYRILQYARESHKIVQGPMGWVWDLRQV